MLSSPMYVTVTPRLKSLEFMTPGTTFLRQMSKLNSFCIFKSVNKTWKIICVIMRVHDNYLEMWQRVSVMPHKHTLSTQL